MEGGFSGGNALGQAPFDGQGAHAHARLCVCVDIPRLRAFGCLCFA